ncbi:hypothetical protein GCM10010911_54270 [Paenibacillus nasutitermitis]|uniref:Uncharacterized protein n=1 Tax=Paenibacillus nasutitermitis TaxID=1652958 RepID=A0A917DZX3_9BACL|nr:hypothetical protein GCM10010911_54270 [Paenibacillus nasutitermitis]
MIDQGLELSFKCVLNKVNDMKEVLNPYKGEACFERVTIEKAMDNGKDKEAGDFVLTLYSKIIRC